MTSEPSFSSSGTRQEAQDEKKRPVDRPVHGLSPLSLALYSFVTGIVAVGFYALLRTLLPAGHVTTFICIAAVLAYCGAAGYLAENVIVRATKSLR